MTLRPLGAKGWSTGALEYDYNLNGVGTWTLEQIAQGHYAIKRDDRGCEDKIITMNLSPPGSAS